jgi:hypothetical protein
MRYDQLNKDNIITNKVKIISVYILLQNKKL